MLIFLYYDFFMSTVYSKNTGIVLIVPINLEGSVAYQCLFVEIKSAFLAFLAFGVEWTGKVEGAGGRHAANGLEWNQTRPLPTALQQYRLLGSTWRATLAPKSAFFMLASLFKISAQHNRAE